MVYWDLVIYMLFLHFAVGVTYYNDIVNLRELEIYSKTLQLLSNSSPEMLAIVRSKH